MANILITSQFELTESEELEFFEQFLVVMVAWTNSKFAFFIFTIENVEMLVFSQILSMLTTCFYSTVLDL